jgi:hypothetical protein
MYISPQHRLPDRETLFTARAMAALVDGAIDAAAAGSP